MIEKIKTFLGTVPGKIVGAIAALTVVVFIWKKFGSSKGGHRR